MNSGTDSLAAGTLCAKPGLRDPASAGMPPLGLAHFLVVVSLGVSFLLATKAADTAQLVYLVGISLLVNTSFGLLAAASFGSKISLGGTASIDSTG
ncbi:hypothetical protein T492DRAFT_877358 [Pavlovales sp. CCMP2436]|nr:hypothetical protein T492DRAFT_877358 [Pavlovales sp. CCMP2436]